jgi:hypothetical protein
MIMAGCSTELDRAVAQTQKPSVLTKRGEFRSVSQGGDQRPICGRRPAH